MIKIRSVLMLKSKEGVAICMYQILNAKIKPDKDLKAGNVYITWNDEKLPTPILN